MYSASSHSIFEVSYSVFYIFHLLKNIYLFIIWLCRVFVAGCELLLAMWDLLVWPKIEPGNPGLVTWSLSHWATRQVPIFHLFCLSMLHTQFLSPFRTLIKCILYLLTVSSKSPIFSFILSIFFVFLYCTHSFFLTFSPFSHYNTAG